MNDYDVLRNDPNAIAFARVPTDFLEISGRDAAAFLQGQVTSDILAQPVESSVESCLLNNTGHLISPLVIHKFNELFWLELPRGRGTVVEAILNRFIVRERVKILDLSSKLILMEFRGYDLRIPGNWVMNDNGWISLPLKQNTSPITYVARKNQFTAETYALDVIFPAELEGITSDMFSNPKPVRLSEATQHILRVESGIPAWSAELTEKTIPLEAGLESSISFTKGCYMGQEVIARIKSRGHTNWQLTKLNVSPSMLVGSELVAQNVDSNSTVHCKITSVALSPKKGWIALGYIRNEFINSNTKFITTDNQWAQIAKT